MVWGKTGGPFFPPSKVFGSFFLSSRLLDYVILLLYLNSLDLNQAENQVFKPTSLFVIVGWGKTGPAHSFPLLNLSIFLLITSSFGLCYSFTLIKHLWKTFTKERIKFSIQQDYCYLYIVVWGKTGGPFFPPSKVFGLFYLSSILLDYVILLLYLNSLDLNQAENQVFKPTSLFVIVGWGKTGPAHSFPLLNLLIFLLIASSFGLCYSFTLF